MRKSKNENSRTELLENIEDIKKEMYVVKSNFNMETDENMIDCYIYQMEALNKKYQYFIRMAKEKGIKADGFEKKGGNELCSRPS